MAAYRPIADVLGGVAVCPRMTRSGHSAGPSASGGNRPGTAVGRTRAERPVASRIPAIHDSSLIGLLWAGIGISFDARS